MDHSPWLTWLGIHAHNYVDDLNLIKQTYMMV